MRRHLRTDAKLLSRKVSEVMTKNPTTISKDKLAVEAFEILQEKNVDELPVVTKSNGNEILGSIWQHDVIETYNKQIFLRDMSGELGGGIRQTIQKKTVPVIDKYFLVHLEAPNVFIDKTLKELALRSRFGADVLLIKKKSSETIQPDANYKIEMGDGLLIFGERESLEKLEKI